jgi:hypothetical protein
LGSRHSKPINALISAVFAQTDPDALLTEVQAGHHSTAVLVS